MAKRGKRSRRGSTASSVRWSAKAGSDWQATTQTQGVEVKALTQSKAASPLTSQSSSTAPARGGPRRRCHRR
eukprot:1465937-Lingulodinium_polyedra.AAC.1